MEFKDVVLLRKVHRAIRAGDERLKGMTKDEQEVYLEVVIVFVSC